MNTMNRRAISSIKMNSWTMIKELRKVKMKKKTTDPIPAIRSALDRLQKQTDDFIKSCKEKIE